MKHVYGWLLLTPAAILLVGFTHYPAVATLADSFFAAGTALRAITGGLIMGVINNGMSLIGAPSERVMLVKGLVLLAAVAYDVWTKRRA